MPQALQRLWGLLIARHYSQHTLPPVETRLILDVPYAEKDEARRVGARWDPARKNWWIDGRNLDARIAAARWIRNPALRAKAQAGAEFLQGRQKRRAERVERQRQQQRQRLTTPVRTEPTSFHLPACCCPCPPWEDCSHTASAARGD